MSRCIRDPRAFALVLSLIAAVVAVATHDVTAQANDRERTMFVSALDDKGEPVEALGPDAFVVREDGARREVLRVSRATEPIDIALLVDNSAATADDIPFLREALSQFVATMATDNKIAVITLADRPTISLDYTDDPKRLSDATNRLFATPQAGMTMVDAVFEVAKGLGRRETPRAVILPVITDGTEFSNRYARDAVDALKQAQAAMFAITIGQFPFSNVQGPRERILLLDEGPRTTGGVRVNLLAPSGLRDSLARMARVLSSQYKVVYGRPQSLIPPEKIEITSSKPDVKMHAAPARGQARS